MCSGVWILFFFKQKTAYEMRISDWSSDVCSSDLSAREGRCAVRRLHARAHDVRDPVLHGPDSIAAVALRGGAHRFAVRGRQHAPDDAHGCRWPGADRTGRAAYGRTVFDRPALDRGTGWTGGAQCWEKECPVVTVSVVAEYRKP